VRSTQQLRRVTIDTKVILIDGNRLTHLMIDHGVGVSTVNMYKIVRLDADYFEEE
jgi:restriction system protein